MIATITRGADFRNLLRYVLDPKHDPALVATNLASQEASPLAWELTIGERERRLQGRPDVGRPVVHVSLSMAHEDRRLRQAELSVLAERFLDRTGYAGCAFVAVEHNDRHHQHVHLVVSRVRSDGSLVRERLGDFRQAMEVCRQLEREFALRRLEAGRAGGARQASRDEYRQSQRTGQASDRARLQQLVGAAALGEPSLTRFVERLHKDGVEVRLWVADDGPVLGISYRLDRIAFKGRSLGPSYTWPGLLRQGMSYDSQQDRETVARLGRKLAQARTGRASAADARPRLRRAIDAALAGNPTLVRFVAALDADGIAVRLNTARTGHVSGITFVAQGRAVRGSELGREYSWLWLQRRGLRFEPQRALEEGSRQQASLAVACRTTAEAGPNGRGRGERGDDGQQPARATALAAHIVDAAQHAHVREAIRNALTGGATLTEFVRRLEAREIAVRLYRTRDGALYAIGFDVGGVHLSAQELGPGFRWRELHQRGLDLDSSRDRAAVDRVAVTLTPSGSPYHQVLDSADRLGYLATTLRAHLQIAQELVDDPVGGIGRAAGRLAWSLAFRGLAEIARETSRVMAEALSKEHDRRLLHAARASSEAAAEGRTAEAVVVTHPAPAAPTQPATRSGEDDGVWPGRFVVNREADPQGTPAGERRSDEYAEARASACTGGRDDHGTRPVIDGQREDTHGAHRAESPRDEGAARQHGDGRGGGARASHQPGADGNERQREGVAQSRGGGEDPLQRSGRAEEDARDRDSRRERGADGAPERSREVPEHGLPADPVVHQTAGDPARGHHDHVHEPGPAAPPTHGPDVVPAASSSRHEGAEATRVAAGHFATVEHNTLSQDSEARHAIESTAAAPAAEQASAAEQAGPGPPARIPGVKQLSENDPAARILAAVSQFDRAMAAAAEDGRRLAILEPADPSRTGSELHNLDPAQLIMAAVEESRRSLAPAERVAGALQHLPALDRIKDLAETPEKAALAAAATVVSLALPKAAPVIGAAASQIEKQIDRSAEFERTR